MPVPDVSCNTSTTESKENGCVALNDHYVSDGEKPLMDHNVSLSDDHKRRVRLNLGTDKLVRQICGAAEDAIRHHHAQLKTQLAAWVPQTSRPVRRQSDPNQADSFAESMNPHSKPVSTPLSWAPQNSNRSCRSLTPPTRFASLWQDASRNGSRKRQSGPAEESLPAPYRELSEVGYMEALFQASNLQADSWPHLKSLIDTSHGSHLESRVSSTEATLTGSGEPNNVPEDGGASMPSGPITSSDSQAVNRSSRKVHLSHEEQDEMNRRRAKSRTGFASATASEFVASITKKEQFAESPIARVVRSRGFENACGFVILANTVMIGVNTSLMVAAQSPGYSSWMDAVSISFTLFFAFEMLARIYADGWQFFKGPDKGWNIFDFIIVVISLIQMFMDFFVNSDSVDGSLGPFSVLRCFRAFRIVRVMRAFRMLRPLRLLLSGIVGTLSSCFWALILLTLIIYTFGVTFTHAAVQYLYGEDRPSVLESSFEQPSIEDLFGTLLKSMDTLFQSICGGINWGVVLHALQSIPGSGWFYVTGFLIYIGFVYLGILNVLTALFCQHAVENALADQEIVLEGKLATMRQMEDKLRAIFQELDDLDQSEDSPEGMITLAELETFMEDRRMKAQFALLGLVPEDAWTLFKLLDRDETDLVNTDAFVHGCMRLRGEATRMDVLSLASHTGSLENLVIGVMQDIAQMRQDFDAIFESGMNSPMLSSKPQTAMSARHGCLAMTDNQQKRTSSEQSFRELLNDSKHASVVVQL